ncbi:MAG: hypothetical protein PUE13_03005 [Clostridiales bacterium]|nr:hypothetical protein [Clostridiales bacterium]
MMKRITLFAGHYGSGKTCIAVSYAEYVKKMGNKVSIVDLDIVNPYFRTKDSERELAELGIELVCSDYANTNLDAPALPKEIYTAISDKSHYLVIDVGGDDRGAVALGRYTPDILEENDYDMLFVANCCRPLTKTPEEALEIMHEIEAASHIAFTGIVNNSNLGDETTAETVKESGGYIKRLSELSGLPVKMTTCTKEVYARLMGEIPDLFEIKLQEKYYAVRKD